MWWKCRGIALEIVAKTTTLPQHFTLCEHSLTSYKMHMGQICCRLFVEKPQHIKVAAR